MIESPSTSIFRGSAAAGLKPPGQSARALFARLNSRPMPNATRSGLLIRVRVMTTMPDSERCLAGDCLETKLKHEAVAESLQANSDLLGDDNYWWNEYRQ